MLDQVEGLRAKGLPAAQLDSTISIDESRLIKDGIKNGSLKLLFVAPEVSRRLETCLRQLTLKCSGSITKVLLVSLKMIVLNFH